MSPSISRCGGSEGIYRLAQECCGAVMITTGCLVRARGVLWAATPDAGRRSPGHARAIAARTGSSFSTLTQGMWLETDTRADGRNYMIAAVVEPVHLYVGKPTLLGVEDILLPLLGRNADGFAPASFPVAGFALIESPADAGRVPTGRKGMRRRAVLRRRVHRTSPISVTPSTSAPFTGAPDALFAWSPSILQITWILRSSREIPAPEVSRVGMPGRSKAKANRAFTLRSNLGPSDPNWSKHALSSNFRNRPNLAIGRSVGRSQKRTLWCESAPTMSAKTDVCFFVRNAYNACKTAP